MTDTKVPVWSWRHAIAKARVPTLTKAVCWAISNYVSDIGEGCYPGTKRLMADTGMSNRALATHLEKASAAGLLSIERKSSDKDGRFQHNHYYPRFPDNVDLPRVSGSGEDVSQPHVSQVHTGEPRELGDMRPVNLVHEPREPRSRKLSNEISNQSSRARKRATTKSKISPEEAAQAESASLTPSTSALTEGCGIATGYSRDDLLEAFRDLNSDRVVRDVDAAFVGFCRSRGSRRGHEPRFKSSVPLDAIKVGAKKRAERAAKGETETITPNHFAWTPWLDHLRNRGERKLAEQIEWAGVMVASMAGPVPGSPLPKPLKTSAKKGARMLEAAA